MQPFRAKTADLSFEWYPDKDTLLSVGFFYKDIGTFIQTLATSKPFSETGLPLSLLASNQTGATLYTITQPINTLGGPLKGVELSAQRPFTFLPGFWSHLGGVANYTRVSSKINYVLTTSATAGSTFTTANLINLSPTSWNLTLCWKNDKVGIARHGNLSRPLSVAGARSQRQRRARQGHHAQRRLPGDLQHQQAVVGEPAGHQPDRPGGRPLDLLHARQQRELRPLRWAASTWGIAYKR